MNYPRSPARQVAPFESGERTPRLAPCQIGSRMESYTMNTNPRANGCYCPSDCGCHRGRPVCGCVAHGGYRLTEHDERHICEQVRELLVGWQRQHAGAGWYSAPDHEVLERVAIGRIGCTSYDLRDVELDWITATVAIIAADMFAGASDFAAWKVQNVRMVEVAR